jgi:hypothetical protein
VINWRFFLPKHEHAEHYSVLAFIFAVGILLLAWFRSELFIQQLIIWGIAAAYIVWGAVHHLLRKDLTLLVFAEYVFVALLAAIFIQSILVNR